MKTVALIAAVAAVIVAVVVANAPPPDDLAQATKIPVADVFAVLEAENDAVRKLWTEEIVGAGQGRGLRFDKDWRDPQTQAGPLPALFLREIAEHLRQDGLPLYLFLGSDFPINEANRFTGLQAEYFAEIRMTGEPQFFRDEEIGMHTAMFSDVAVAQACVACHNSEPETPKADWKVGDIMGATTWSYPKEEVAVEEALSLVGALRDAVRVAYEHYLDEVETFDDPPAVGAGWPADGYLLPSADQFMHEAEARASARTMQVLLRYRQSEG